MSDEKLKNALSLGTRLSSGQYTYTVRSVLGAGGFGITYYGELNARVGNISGVFPVALKEFFPSSLCERLEGSDTMSYSNPTRERVEKGRRDFLGEARRLSSLAGRHRGIVAVNEVFEANNTVYYVMEYLDGMTLAAKIGTYGPMSEEDMLAVMVPVIDAVAFLHGERITHLDIKPLNIMIVDGEPGGDCRPVLIDFGLSKHYNPDGSATSTINDGGYSEGFAPREQYRGITTFSPSADVYAIGATMLYCLTGQRLPSSLDLTEEMIEQAIPVGVSPAMRRILQRALSLHATGRYRDARELLAAINTVRPGRPSTGNPLPPGRAVTSTPMPAKQPSSKKVSPEIAPSASVAAPRKTSRTLWIVIAAIVIAMLAGAGVYMYNKIGSGADKEKSKIDSTGVKEEGVLPMTQPDTDEEYAVVENKQYILGTDVARYTGPVDGKERPHGDGVAKDQNGTYAGEFEHGARHGKGKYEFNNGDVYEGTFDQNHFGSGTYTYKSGVKFVGEFKNDRPYNGVYIKNGKTVVCQNGKTETNE